jgi:RNA recognition motif-containing protein
MHKHIKENGHWYLLVLIFIAIFSYSKINDYIESYDPPEGIVVNMQGEILKQSDKQKESRQGIKFWQHQLDAVREAINQPEKVIALSDSLNEIRLQKSERKKMMESIMDEALITKNLNTPHLESQRMLKKEIEQKEEQLENLKTSQTFQTMYEVAVKRQPELRKLEEIIKLKLNNFKD